LEAALIKLSSPATREYWEIPVLLEDERLLVVAKPAGLAVSPDRLAPDRPSLLPLLHQGIAGGKPWARERGITYLAPVHRLDPEASGVLVLARSKATLIHLLNLVASEKPFITYLALVEGAAADDQFEVDAPLARRPAPAGFVRVDPRHGKKSRTRFEVVERFSNWTLLRCQPFFNRPHQVRAHLRHAGFPLVGDSLYGGHPLLLSRLKPDYRLKAGAVEKPLIGRPALHAERVDLADSPSERAIAVTAPVAKDMVVALKYLGRFGKGRTQEHGEPTAGG